MPAKHNLDSRLIRLNKSDFLLKNQKSPSLVIPVQFGQWYGRSHAEAARVPWVSSAVSL